MGTRPRVGTASHAPCSQRLHLVASSIRIREDLRLLLLRGRQVPQRSDRTFSLPSRCQPTSHDRQPGPLHAPRGHLVYRAPGRHDCCSGVPSTAAQHSRRVRATPTQPAPNKQRHESSASPSGSITPLGGEELPTVTERHHRLAPSSIHQPTRKVDAPVPACRHPYDKQAGLRPHTAFAHRLRDWSAGREFHPGDLALEESPSEPPATVRQVVHDPQPPTTLGQLLLRDVDTVPQDLQPLNEQSTSGSGSRVGHTGITIAHLADDPRSSTTNTKFVRSPRVHASVGHQLGDRQNSIVDDLAPQAESSECPPQGRPSGTDRLRTAHRPRAQHRTTPPQHAAHRSAPRAAWRPRNTRR